MKLLTLPFSIIVKNYDLLAQLTRREIDAQNRGSWLGKLWLVLQPLLLLSVYTLVFSTIYEGRYGVVESETPIEYALGIFLGIALLAVFNGTFYTSAMCINSNRNYVKKVVFPLEILPITVVLSSLYTFTISLVLIFLGTILFTDAISLNALWLPVVILPVIIFAMGIAWTASAIGVFYRDVGPIINVATTCMLWCSAVFYSARDIPPSIWAFARFNPIMLTIESSRDVLLWQLAPNMTWLMYSYTISFVTFFFGFWIFRSLRNLFADVV